MRTTVPYRPRHLAKGSPWPAVLACAAIALAIILAAVSYTHLRAHETF